MRMFSDILKKFFAPINRWSFTFGLFLYSIFIDLYMQFVEFLGFTDIVVTVYTLCFIFAIILFVVFKRFLDIFAKAWKAILATLISVAGLVVTGLMSFLATTYYTNGTMTGSKAILLLSPTYSIILLLFLCLKNSPNSKIFNFDWKIAIKRVILLIFLFSIYKVVSVTYNAMPRVDYRMYPALELSDKLLVSKITKNTPLKREDIVCIKNKENLPNPLRIIGLPGEKVKLDSKKIYINGEVYSDKFAFYSIYLKPTIDFQETIKLDNNSYLLIGDNRYYDKRSEIFNRDKNGNGRWRAISEKDKTIYMTLKKDELFGKVIAIHYDDYKFDNKYSEKKVSRDNTGYVFATKNKKFGFNPSSNYERLFGKP